MMNAGQEMMRSVKSNLSQKRSKTRYFGRKVDAENPSSEINQAPKFSESELAEFRAAFKKKQQRWTIKVWGISLLAGGILFLIIMLGVS